MSAERDPLHMSREELRAEVLSLRDTLADVRRVHVAFVANVCALALRVMERGRVSVDRPGPDGFGTAECRQHEHERDAR